MAFEDISNPKGDWSPPSPVERFFHPIRSFASHEAAGGIVLLICAVIALIWANSPWSESYYHLWHTEITVGIAGYSLTKDLHYWINDGLMAVFFFVVGLEIKREILVGELSTGKKAMLPIFGALGGMLVPALLYTLLNFNKPSEPGWGIPMATDIAFALGVLALLGKRVPISLKVFLTALAIVDDIGAVLVIALFYTSHIVWLDILIGAGVLGVLLAGNVLGVRTPVFYGILGIGGLWLAFLLSGVHATVAGVLAAFTIPARTRINAREFLERGRTYLNYFETAHEPESNVLSNRAQLRSLNQISAAVEKAQTPLQRLENALSPWVAFFIMPLFALANAGVSFGGNLGAIWTHSVSLGIILGLFLGKQVGIFFFSWLSIKLGLGERPYGVSWLKLYGVSILGGVGFTMSLFIAGLAFGQPSMDDMAKMGILFGSLISGVVGFVFLRSVLKPPVSE